MTAILGRHLLLPGFLTVPEEGPAEHCRNALMILTALARQQPAVWQMNPELERAARRTGYAITLMDARTHYAPILHVVQHVRRAVEALIDVPVDWDVIPDLRGACARLLRALFQLEAM